MRSRLGEIIMGLALAVAIVIASVATAWVVRDRAEASARHENVRLAETSRGALQRFLVAELTSLRGAAGLTDSQGRVDPVRFRAFAAAIRSPRGIVRVDLAQVVRAAERRDFEARTKRLITELAGRGEFRPARARSEYLPITAVWPETNANRRVLGLDLLGDLPRRRVVQLARATRDTTLTTLVPLAVSGSGFLAVQPLYARGSAGTPTAFVTAVLDRSLIDAELGDLPLDARVRVTLDGAEVYATDVVPSGGSRRAAMVGGRTLLVQADGGGASHAAAKLILAGGLLLSWLLCAFLWATSAAENRLVRAHEAEHAARLRAELLERNAAHLAAAVTVNDVAASIVADLAASGFRHSGVFGVRGDRLEVLATSGLSEETVDQLHGRPLDSGFAAADAIRTGTTVEFETGEDYDARYPGFAGVRQSYRLEAVMAVPLRRADGRVIGALFVGSAERRWLDESRRLVLGGVAEQTGLALERARLQEEAEATAADSTFLALLSDQLERVTTTRRRARRLVEVLVGERASFAAVHLYDEEEPRLLAAAGVWPDELDDERLAALVREPPKAPQSGSAPLVLSLRARGHAIGALTLVRSPADDDGPPLDNPFAREIASRSAVALDNARLYERERNVSHELQLGLLGGGLLEVDHAVVAAAYRPAAEGLEVGGDWFDAFRLETGAIALVVGDVVGHGLQSAVAMGQLRGAVRALGPTGSPARVLERLDTFVEGLPAGEMATVAYVELDPASGWLRYACAGHPPPLVVSSEGRTRYLWEGRSAPLGSLLGAERQEGDDRLQLGETLMLFTDGLVERRSESFDVGLERLSAAAADYPPAAAGLVDHVCDSLLADSDHDDDVCVLMFHRASPGRAFEHSFPASPAELATLRGRFRAWLRDHNVADDVEHATVLAVSEAAANAVEHAYGSNGNGIVTVAAQLSDDGELVVEVSDRGRWRDPREASERGRGTPIMRATMDHVTVEGDDVGTVVRLRRSLGEGRPG